MSDSTSESQPVVVPPWGDDIRKLPTIIDLDNVCDAIVITANSAQRSVIGAYRIGAFLIEEKPDLNALILKTGVAISSLERWKGFTKKCRKASFTEKDILDNGGTYSAIAKALKGPSKDKPKKPKCSLDDIEDLKELRAEAKRKIKETAQLVQTQVRTKLKAKHEKELEAKDKTIEELKAKIKELQKPAPKSKTPAANSVGSEAANRYANYPKGQK